MSDGGLPSDVKCWPGEMQGGDIYIANLTVADGIAWCSAHTHCGGLTAKAGSTACVGAGPTGVLELHFKDPWGCVTPRHDAIFGRYSTHQCHHFEHQIWYTSEKLGALTLNHFY